MINNRRFLFRVKLKRESFYYAIGNYSVVFHKHNKTLWFILKIRKMKNTKSNCVKTFYTI